MLDHSKLLDFNPQLGLQNGIYQDTSNPFRDSTVSNYLQIAVAEVFARAPDKSAFSTDIEAQLNTAELKHELQAAPYNYLLSLNLEDTQTALDLSQDFGAISHFLARQVETVDSVKIDSDRTRLSIERCAEYSNICHISEDISKLALPKNHYDLIVIGALEALFLSNDQLQALLNKLRQALSSQGVLLVNSANLERVAKWFDAQGMATANTVPFADFYQTPDTVATPASIEKLLRDSDFGATDSYLSFSTANHISNIFHADYLLENSYAANHFYRLGAIENSLLNEYLFFERLFTDPPQVVHAASRIVLLASASKAANTRLLNIDFAHYPGTSRKPQWRTVTSRERAADLVTKTPLYPNLSQPSAAPALVSQNLESQTFHTGEILVASWLHAVLEQDFSALKTLVERYRCWLQDLHAQDNGETFQRIAYDLLPFNLLSNQDQDNSASDYQTIDTEWQLNKTFDSNFVMFRALFWFAFENKNLLATLADSQNILTVGDFIERFLGSAKLTEYAQLEEVIQAAINTNFRAHAVVNALTQPFASRSAQQTLLQCQLQWSNADGEAATAHAIQSAWSADLGPQTINLKLPANDADKKVLRIDPLASRGLFRINSLKILAADATELIALKSADKVNSDAQLLNIHVDAQHNSCLALNDDPHFLFDLSGIADLTTVTECEINLELIQGASYKGQLASLSDTVNFQNGALANQAARLNEYRAEMEFMQRRLTDLSQHRADLTQLLNEQRIEQVRDRRREANRANLRFTQMHQEIVQLDADKRRTVRHLNQQLTHLNDQLIAQIHHNQAMDRYLTLRPTTRVKRFLSRSVRRLLGREPIADAPELEAGTELESSEEPAAETPNNSVEKAPPPELIGQNLEDYQLWIEENTLSAADINAAKQLIASWDEYPVFSILVPIYNTDPDYLLPMIRSVQAQIYPHWQLCLVDDCSPKKYLRTLLEVEAAKDSRICLKFNERNQGIALTSNDALALAEGDYIALLDHDDELSIDALFENAKVIKQQPNVGLIYSDEDKMDMQGNRLEPYFKPDYSPDLLDTNNYICHFTVIDKRVANRIGGFREGLDGSQDHDIILRAIAESERVVHIPKVLYHWRKIPGSTAVEYDSKSYAWEAGRQAVEDCLQAVDSTATVEFGSLKGTYRVFREIRGEPLVSIVIPFKDKAVLLDACLGSILERTGYQNYEIIGVSNNSEEQATFARMEHFSKLDNRIRFYEKNIPFNFSAICNYGVEQAKGEYIVLLNNDIEVQQGDWLERLLEHAQRPDVGAVGGKLLYPDGRIQHAGIVVGMVGAAGHPHKFFPDNHIGYHGRLHMVYNVSAVTGAMLMVSKEKYLEVGGLDEENLAVAYNDVDLCLKLLDHDYLNLFTPHARATHHESISRGYEDTDEKLNRLKAEQQYFLHKWADFIVAGDPYYNPNLSLENESFSLNFKSQPASNSTPEKP